MVLGLITATALSRADDHSGTGVEGLSDVVVSILWRVPTGQPVTRPPAVTPDGVFLGGTDGKIRAFALADGGARWTMTVAAGEATYARATGGVVYATTAGGAIVAVDAGTGRKLWSVDTGTTFSAALAIGNDRVYAGGRDAALYAYRITGSHRRQRAWTGGEIRTTPILVGDAAIVASTDGKVYAAVGSWIRWKRDIGRPAEGPVAAGDAACTPLTDGSVQCVRAADGRVLPRIKLPATQLSAPASDGRLLFAAGRDGSVGAWDPDTGAQQWLFRPRHPAAGPGHLVRNKERVVVAYPDGRLIGLDTAAGSALWDVTLPDRFDTAPRIDDRATYVVGRTGTLYALRTPGTAETAEPSPAPPATATTTTSPRPRTQPHPQGHPSNPTTSEPSGDSPSPKPTTEPATPIEQPTDIGGQ